jgi:hypothetical protein
VAYEGQVSGSAQRWEVERGAQVLVWSFRLERESNDGEPLPRLPVEMRASGYDGNLIDGDWVRVDGHWSDGETLHVREVKNLTTGATIRGRHSGGVLHAIGQFVGLIVALGILAIAALLALQVFR